MRQIYLFVTGVNAERDSANPGNDKIKSSNMNYKKLNSKDAKSYACRLRKLKLAFLFSHTIVSQERITVYQFLFAQCPLARQHGSYEFFQFNLKTNLVVFYDTLYKHNASVCGKFIFCDN